VGFWFLRGFVGGGMWWEGGGGGDGGWFGMNVIL